MMRSTLVLLAGLVLGLEPQPDASGMRASIELKLDSQKTVSFAYQTLPVSKRAEKPPQVGPEEAGWRLYALAFAGEFKTNTRLKCGEQEFQAGSYEFFVQARAEGGHRLVIIDGPKSRPVELELARSSVDYPYLTLSLAPTAQADFELTVAWGKDVGRARFWVAATK
jgi:hypothetical protein